jgi:hypothetical protein
MSERARAYDHFESRSDDLHLAVGGARRAQPTEPNESNRASRRFATWERVVVAKICDRFQEWADLFSRNCCAMRGRVFDYLRGFRFASPTAKRRASLCDSQCSSPSPRGLRFAAPTAKRRPSLLDSGSTKQSESSIPNYQFPISKATPEVPPPEFCTPRPQVRGLY